MLPTSYRVARTTAHFRYSALLVHHSIFGMPSTSKTSGTGFSSKKLAESCRVGKRLVSSCVRKASIGPEAAQAAPFSEKLACLPQFPLRKLVLYAGLLRLLPPAPAKAKMVQTRNTQMIMLAVSPWIVPMPRSQYQ